MNPIKGMTTFSDTVDYHPYDPNLPAVFDEVKKIIQQSLPHISVEHVGSTSIPGVGGRNAIDIVIPAVTPDHTMIKSRLYVLGFQDSPFRHFLPLLVGTIAYQAHEYPLLLYVLTPESDVYQEWIRFRDYLRAHPEDAQAYDRVKQQTLAAGTIEGRRYQQAKTPFLVSLMEKIQRSADSQG